MINRQKLIEELEKNSIFRKVTNAEGKNVIEIIESQPPADQWIPCSVAVPANVDPSVYDDIVIKRASGKTVKGCCWSDYPRWWGEKDGDWFEVHDAVAWMPLPEPYKGDE